MITTAIRHSLIMAAGRGNRMRPLTDTLPKAMAPYKGDTLIGASLRALQRNGAKVHVTVGYKAAMLSQYLIEVGIDSIFNTEGHPNSWWIHHTVMRYVNEPVLVLTCDNITEIDFEFLESEYARLGTPACMVVPVRPIPLVDGDYIEHDAGIVRAICRDTRAETYCSGIQVVNPGVVVEATRGGGDFYAIWRQLIDGRLLKAAAVYPKQWFSVDTLEQLQALP